MDMRHTRRRGFDHPSSFELDQIGAHALEQSNPIAQKKRRNVDAHFIEEPRLYALLGNVRAMMLTSLSPAAILAFLMALSIPSVTNSNFVVPLGTLRGE